MRWITFILLLYIFAACQVAGLGALGAASGHRNPQVEYVVVLAVFYALYASEDAAPLAGLICGLAYDLLTGEPLGLNAVPLALVAWMIVRVRLSIFREMMLTQFVIAFFAIFLLGLFSGALRVLVPWAVAAKGGGAGGGPDYSVWALIAERAASGFYSAILAPAVFWVLLRIPILGFHLRGPRGR